MPRTGSAIAKLLGVDRKHVESILDRLCEKGMIAKVNRGIGCACHYMLNTNVVHFGKNMQDVNASKVFSDCAYEPPVTVKYKEEKPK